MHNKVLGLLGAFLILVFPADALAQQKIGYVDSEYILNKLPEYATIQQQIDRKAQDWEQEIRERQNEVDERFREYQARELLYTHEERQRKRQDIVEAESEVERLRMRYFGPDGEYFTLQDQLMMPVQEKVLAAIEEVATSDGYDYVLDKNGEIIFLFVREQFDLSDKVLEELGIDLTNTTGRTGVEN